MNDIEQVLHLISQFEEEKYGRSQKVECPLGLRDKILECRKANRHWNYSRIARYLGCSPTPVRLTLDRKAAAKVALASRKKNKMRRKARAAFPVIEPPSIKSKNAEIRLGWYLRRLIKEGVPHFYRGGYCPTAKYIGSSVNILKGRLEAQFEEGMNWKTLGKVWMIKHRVGLRRFNLRETVQRRMAFHWSNLVPVKVKKRIRKMSDQDFQLEMNRLYNQVRNEDYYENKENSDLLEEWEKYHSMTPRPIWSERHAVPDYLTFLSCDDRPKAERATKMELTKSLYRMRRRKHLTKARNSAKSLIPLESASHQASPEVALLS